MHVCSMIPILMIYIPIVFSPKIHGLLRLNPCTHGPNYDEIHVTVQFHPAFWNFDRNHSILTFDFHTLPPFAHWFLCLFGGTWAVSLARKTPKTHGNGRLMAVATDAPPKTKTKTESEEVRLIQSGCWVMRWVKKTLGKQTRLKEMMQWEKKGWLKLNPQWLCPIVIVG